MAVERDNQEEKGIEAQKQKLLLIVENSEFGTSQFKAISDYIESIELFESQVDRIERLALEHDTPESRIRDESSLRVAEFQRVLLEHEIYLSKTRLKGYSKAYKEFGDEYESLTDLAADEADERFPMDVEQQIRHGQAITAEVLRKVRDILAQKMNRE